MSANVVLYEEFLQLLKDTFAAEAKNMSMSVWVEKNTTLKRKPFSYRGYEFQRQILDDMHPNMDVKKPSQVGLALACDTPVPTVDGWTTMGEITVGTRLFDERGQVCTVQYVSPIYTDHICYRITFDDGQSIVADAGHRWYVEVDRAFDPTGKYRGKGRPMRDDIMFNGGVLDTQTIATFHKEGERNRFAVPNTAPLDLPEADLPVDPYFFGLWLGDGNSHACVLTAHRDDVEFYKKELERRNLVTLDSSRKGDTEQFRVHLQGQKRPGKGAINSLCGRLTEMGLLKGKKFIPSQYLRASAPQRRDLLRGLLDTDGTITKRGRVSFYNTNPELVAAVEDLANSLGFKTRTRWRMNAPSTMKSGHVITPRHPVAELSFVAYAEDDVFLLPRKRQRLTARAKGRPAEALRRRIISVEAVDTVPVRCISVDSPNHLFLAGTGMIPTHNTEIELRKALAFARRNSNTTVIFTLPNEEMYGRTSLTRLRPILDSDKVFRPIGASKPVKNVHTIQVGRSFVIMAAAIESAATSTPADMVLNDEVDLSDQAMLTLFRSRMQNSNFKINQRFSTPTHIKFGIDENFAGTDNHRWMRRCQACGKHQVVSFDLKHIAIPGLTADLETLVDIEERHLNGHDWNEAYVKCVKCGTALDMGDPMLCEWVPEYPENKNRRGYHVTPFCTSRLTPGYILGELFEYKRKSTVTLRRFYNTVLGEAFTDASQRLSHAEIIKAFEPAHVKGPQNRDVPVSIGIDVGASCHIVLGIPGLAFGFMIVPASKLLDTLKDLDTRYRIATGCIDRHPFEPTANEIFQWSKGRILPTEYRGQPEVAIIRDRFKTITHGQVNRTACIDAVVQDIRNGVLRFAEYGSHKDTILTHLQDMVRKDDEPEKEAVWEKLKGNDHFFHAMALMRIAPRFRSLAQFESDEEKRVESDSMVISVAPMAGLGPQPRTGFGIRQGGHHVLG